MSPDEKQREKDATVRLFESEENAPHTCDLDDFKIVYKWRP